MSWCRFFIPKIASPNVKPGDPDLNEHIMYAKCVKGHVIRDANDWLFCENLPAPNARCWQEGGETLFALKTQQQNAATKNQATGRKNGKSPQNAAPAKSRKA